MGIPAALSPSVGFSFLSSARRVSPLPHARPAGDLPLPRSLPRTPRPSPSPNPRRVLFTRRSPLSPGLRPRGRRSPNLGHRGPLCAHPRAPRSPTRPSDRTQPCSLPRLVSPSPQLQPARRSPALPRSWPLGPGSDTTESWSRSGLNASLSSGGSMLSIAWLRVPRSRASVPSSPPPPRPARLPLGKSLQPAVRRQVRAALPRSAPRARLLPSRPSRGSGPSSRTAGALAHRRLAQATVATAAAAAGAGAGGAGARRARQPWGSRSARIGDARLWGLSRLTVSRGVGAGAGAGAPAAAEPGRLGAGATCLPRSAGGAGRARPLAPSCTHPGDLSASLGVRAPHSHHPPRPPPAAPLPSPPGPLPQPLLPGGRVWGTKEPASALSGRTFPAARRTRPLRFELGPERRAPSRAEAPDPSPRASSELGGLGEWKPSGLRSRTGLRRNTQSCRILSYPLFLLRPSAPCPSLYCRDNSLKAAQSCQRFGFP